MDAYRFPVSLIYTNPGPSVIYLSSRLALYIQLVQGQPGLKSKVLFKKEKKVQFETCERWTVHTVGHGEEGWYKFSEGEF